jgi:periplasmic protein TonB
MSHSGRNALIAGGVVLLHVAFLWALQTGLLRRAAEVVVPVELLSVIITPPAPEAPPVPQPKAEEPIQQPVVRKSMPVPRPAPQPVAVPDRTPAPSAPTATREPQPPAPPITAPMTSAAPPAPAAPTPPAPRVEVPISDADYLQNPKPEYPRMSSRLGEEGTTIMRVLIGTDGRALDAQVAKSSGFARLDQAADETVRKWKYVPGKRGGVPEVMWVNVPIKWELKKD